MNGSRRYRKPTALAIIIGSVCFLISLGIVGTGGVLLFLWINQLNTTLAVALTWIGPLPLVVLIGWMTVTMMDVFEKVTDVSLRTKSTRTQRVGEESG